jgi:hypothetical protein
MMSTEKLPELGKKTFTVKVSILARAPVEMDVDNIDQYDQVQKTFLRLAHSIGKPEEVSDRVKEMLFQTCFLLRWTVFEVFLRTSIHELFLRHPCKLTYSKRSMKPSVSYKDIMTLSANFSSIDSLREALVERQIEQSEAEGQKVHGLINLLKCEFQFYDDPYKAWYVLDGQQHESDYNTLLEIKEVRNSLVHDGGSVPDTFITRFPNVPTKDHHIVIDDTYNTKAMLVFAAIAYKISDSVVQGKYRGDGTTEIIDK